MNKSLNRVLIFSLLVALCFGSAFAQPGPPDPPVDNPVPITGIEYLIAAGAAFGAKKIYEKKKAK
ncbi:MAG: hypothetical protein ACI9XJ_000083 [Marivirga sp.]|jgi:hypothetical protein